MEESEVKARKPKFFKHEYHGIFQLYFEWIAADGVVHLSPEFKIGLCSSEEELLLKAAVNGISEEDIHR